MRVDDVGRRVASSLGALLWQQVAVEIIRRSREEVVIPSAPRLSGLISTVLLSLSGGIGVAKFPGELRP